MSAQRTFSYEFLKRLVTEHPDWTPQEFAAALTAEVRERLNDPGYPMIRPNTVSAALSRYRPTWEEQGIRMPARRTGIRLLPWAGIPESYWMDTPLRRLRWLERLAAGEPGVDPRNAHMARQFQRRLQESRSVVDLHATGKPYIRAARPDEIDGEGRIISLYARWPGLTEKQWKKMTPDEREQAAGRWLAGPADRAGVSRVI